ncbi:MAG: sulfite exporter TauE/SafE family protein [Rhodospirillales bacterium]|nr:sulfite exporter TauE/SafE family protein [Rhodospirillales bacterium]
MLFPVVEGVEFNSLTVSLILAVFFVAGLAKGAIGFGLPIIAISLLSSFIPVSVGLALNVIPPVILNVWQATHKASLASNAKRIWPVLLGLAAGIALTTQIITGVPPQLILGMVGVVILLFCINSRWGMQLTVPKNREKPYGLLTGLICGIMGGLTTVSVPPFLAFLVTLGLNKDEFVSTLGLYFVFASICLIAAFSFVGLLNATFIPFALACTAVAGLGMWCGFKIRNRLDQKKFYNAVLVMMALISLNLIRRAVF